MSTGKLDVSPAFSRSGNALVHFGGIGVYSYHEPSLKTMEILSGQATGAAVAWNPLPEMGSGQVMIKSFSGWSQTLGQTLNPGRSPLPTWLALGLLAAIYAGQAPLNWAHYTDPVVYLSGAQGLAEGQGYRFVPYVNSPRIGCHPPLQSAFLSLFWRIDPTFPDNLPLLYGAMIGCALGALWLFTRVARHSGLPPALALALALCWGLSPSWGTLIYSFFSDILFTALWLGLALYWLTVRTPDSDRHWMPWCVTGLFLASLYLTRTAAMPLVVVVAGIHVCLWRRRRDWKPAVVCLTPVGLAVLGWKYWAAGSPGYLDYIGHRADELGGWTGLAPILLGNALDCISGQGFLHCLFPSLLDLPSSNVLVATIWSPVLTALVMVAGWLFMACAMYGVWKCGTSVDRLGGWMVGAYLAQLILYPTSLGDRGLYPVLPYVIVWAWKGRGLVMRVCSSVLNDRVWAGAAALFMAANVAANAHAFLIAQGYLLHSNYSDDLAEIGDWLRTNTPPETVVAASLSEPILHLHHQSGRRVIENYFQRQPFFSIVSNCLPGSPRADYLLLSWYSWYQLKELNFQRFELVASSSRAHYRLYRVGRGSPGNNHASN